ncbi:MAG: lytic transglycosylase domain-containing protein [Deltaproteobacteria bacterium]|nr:lytic transglycosylase domain-containing protein [Deltaproteobacteria bacterium]
MRVRTIAMLCTAVLLFLLVPAAVPAATATTPKDKAVLAVHDAFLARNAAKLEAHAQKAKGHVLDPYVEYWRLRLRLQEADPEEVRDFLGRHAGSFMAEQLRREWLRVLGKAGQWEDFTVEYPALVKGDSEIAGYALQARWIGQDITVLADVKSLWNTPKAIPEGCLPLVETMLTIGDLTPRDLRQRFRILVQAGLFAEAKRVAERLPPGQAPSAGQIDSAAREPVRFLERPVDLKTSAGRELAIAAVIRLAQSDPQAAAGYWAGRLGEAFPLEDRQFLWGMIATQGARRSLPEAVEWFGKAGATPLSDEQLAWRARIALRQGNWHEVKVAIERMSREERSEPAWIYWLGRSLCALGVPEAGREQWGRIAGEHHFYGQLAAEEMGMTLRVPPKAAPVTSEELARANANGGLQRALALYRLGLRTEATREWVWSIRTMDDRSLLAAAELARRHKIWDRVMNTADRTVAVHDFSLRYLTPYHELLTKQAQTRKIEEPLVFGLVRQESRFIAEAKSSAGAAGLMQILPSTARWAARKLGMKGFRPSRVCRPDVNAALGAYYLRHVLDGFKGNLVLAAAAYNAGPGRARRWCDTRPLEGAIYVETIPFSETRQYVKKVMANTFYYSALLGGKVQSLKSRLGVINGNGAVGAVLDGPDED